MSFIEITNKPSATFTFKSLPSWNESISIARGNKYAAGKDTKIHRIEGCVAARNWLKDKDRHRPYFTKQIAIVASVWKKTAVKYDIHNLYLKATIDGFKDAELFQDDNIDYVPILIMKHMGVDRLNPRVEIAIYEI